MTNSRQLSLPMAQIKATWWCGKNKLRRLFGNWGFALHFIPKVAFIFHLSRQPSDRAATLLHRVNMIALTHPLLTTQDKVFCTCCILLH